jgi:choline monooxygenase
MALVLRTCRRLLPPLQQQAFSSLKEGWPDASEPIERARTPPASWYTDRAVLRAEEARVFRRHWQVMMLWPAAWVWLPERLSLPSGRGLDLCMPRRAAPQAVGHVQQVEGAGDYFTGSLLGQGYVVCRDDEGQLRAFYNVRREGRRGFLSVSAKVCGAAPLVRLAIGPRTTLGPCLRCRVPRPASQVCRHHASPVAAGAGRTPRFTCPYHGWTYRLDGRLLAAPRVGGIERFRAADHGLVPLEVDTWGPFVFVRAPGGSREGSVADWLGAGGQQALQCGLGDAGLVAVAERQYPLACNWKVFVDNYLVRFLRLQGLSLAAEPALPAQRAGLSRRLPASQPHPALPSCRTAATTCRWRTLRWRTGCAWTRTAAVPFPRGCPSRRASRAAATRA